MLSMANAEMLIHAFMTSWLDHCNGLLGGCSVCLINKLQLFQKSAVGLVLSKLHWLPIKHSTHFKIRLLTYKSLNGLAPQYFSKLLLHYSPSHPL